MKTDERKENMQPLLKIENLAKNYTRRKLAGQPEEVRALDGVSFSVCRGNTLALVGESGSGKSTLAFCLACLEKPTSGIIWFEGADIVKLSEKDQRAIRRQIQLIFQDPASSLNPRWSVTEIVTEPLVLQGNLSRAEMTSRVHVLLDRVGLSAGMGEKLPSELSGGQRQRVAIARALTLEPKLLILDEALSALDCSVQAQIANLLVELQDSLGMSYVFISHDLAMAAHLADEIAVMSNGRIAEQGSTVKILKEPQSTVTCELLAAMPHMNFSRVQVPES